MKSPLQRRLILFFHLLGPEDLPPYRIRDRKLPNRRGSNAEALKPRQTCSLLRYHQSPPHPICIPLSLSSPDALTWGNFASFRGKSKAPLFGTFSPLTNYSLGVKAGVPILPPGFQLFIYNYFFFAVSRPRAVSIYHNVSTTSLFARPTTAQWRGRGLVCISHSAIVHSR